MREKEKGGGNVQLDEEKAKTSRGGLDQDELSRLDFVRLLHKGES